MQPRREPTPRRRGPELVTTLTDGGAAARLQVYAVHPGALPATGWRGLAEALPADVAVHVANLDAVTEYVTAADPAGTSTPSVSGLATRVAAALPAPPAGAPVVLVGWSFGGVVAYEIGATAAHRPHALVLLDSIAPVSRFTVDDRELVDGDTLIRWFAMYLCAKRGTALPAGVDLGGGTEQDRLLRLLRWCASAGVLPPDTPPAGLLKLYRSFLGGLSRNNRVVRDYRPQPTVLPTALVKPAGSLLPEHGALGWPELTLSGFTLRPCPGDHYTMLREASVWSVVADLVMQHHPSRREQVPPRRQVPAQIR
jgi:thioesterase domain-containing protein